MNCDRFIILCSGQVMQLDRSRPELPPGGVLVMGSSGTLFRTRGRAEKAIRRTVRYAESKGLPWPILDSTKRKIRRVHEES